MAEDLKVFITTSEASCDECGEELGRRAWITLVENKGALCLACADLEHLVFLPSGDAALTRRARKHSTLAAVVLKWSRARKRYERQGLLVESQALDEAEEECLSDSEARARRGEREAERRAGWQLLLIFDMPRQSTTGSWPTAMIDTLRGRKWKTQLTACWSGGKRGERQRRTLLGSGGARELGSWGVGEQVCE